MNSDIETLDKALQAAGYIADPALTTTLHLADRLQRPVLLEGEAGVGKTAVAKALAQSRDTELVRLQCFEGIDLAAAAYEGNYARQLLSIKLHEHDSDALTEADIFDEQYLLERPLLKAIRQAKPPVLLIDEVDRADEAFEAFLLEVLSEFQISVPEIGTLTARSIPCVILTSNATRELSDALRRRCLYHYIDYPDRNKELAILQQRLPDLDTRVLTEIVAFVHQVRQLNLAKRPGIAESLDWATALTGLGVDELAREPDTVLATLGCLLKTSDDLEQVDNSQLDQLLSGHA